MASAPAAEFLRWLAREGVDTGALAWPVTLPRSGRGVAAAASAPAGAELLRIPGRLVWTAARCRALLEPWLSARLPHLADEDGGADEEVIALAVLCESGRGAASPWAAYVGALPPRGTYDLLPSEWPPAQLGWLRDRDAAAAAAARAAVLGGDFGQLLDALGTPPAQPGGGCNAVGAVAAAIAAALSLRPAPPCGAGGPDRSPRWEPSEDSAAVYRWARHSVQSRVFLNGLDADPMFLPPPGAGGGSPDGLLSLAMVPYGDMFNHSGGAGSEGGAAAGAAVGGDGAVVLVDAEWHAPSGGPGCAGGAYVLRAPCAVPAGCEVAISYGDRPGRDLLETYGFVLPLRDNPAEAVSVRLAPLIPGGAAEEDAACGNNGGGGDDDDDVVERLLKSPGLLPDPLPAGLRGDAGPQVGPRALHPALAAARARLCGALSASPALELSLPPGAAEALAAGSPLPHPIPPAEPDGDSLAVLRALVLEEADAPALAAAVAPRGGPPLPAGTPAGLGALLRVRPERLTRPVSRDNELAALRLLGALLAAGADELGGAPSPRAASPTAATSDTDGGSAAPTPPAGFADAAGLARRLSRCMVSCATALACAAWAPGASPTTLAARYAAALTLRANRCGVLLSHALYVARMLGVAEGSPGAGVQLAADVNAALAGAAASLAELTRPGAPAFALEVQEPWASALLAGAKTVETRAYPLPEPLAPSPPSGGGGAPLVRVALLRSPSPGGLAAHGLAAGEVVGCVAFSGCREYASRGEWDADRPAHGVPDGHPQFDWGAGGAGGPRYGWVVHAPSVVALPAPLPLEVGEGQRVVRSVFALRAAPRV